MEANKEWVVYRDQKRKMSKQKQHLMKGQTVWFDEGQWKEHNIGRACLLLKKWQVKQLLIMKAGNKQMIREITNIKFPNLVFISLQQNNIESVESLSRIRFPYLRQLNLEENLISIIKNIRKMRSKRLHDIKLNHNLCLDCCKITELKTDPEVKTLQIQKIWDNEMSSDTRWITKVSAFKIQQLCKQPQNTDIGSRKRIREEALVQALKRKYKFHKIFVKEE